MSRSPRVTFWQLQLAGWAAYFVMIVATFLPMLPAGTSIWPLVRVKVVRTALGFALTCLLRLAYRRLDPGRFGVAAAVSLVGSVAFGIAWRGLTALLFWAGDELGHAGVDWTRAPREALDYALTLLAWSAFYFGIKWARDLEQARAGALEARALAQQAELDVLRYQLNPHFLFNALNSIRALVDEDRGRAKHMITALSEFLRYPILGERRTVVPLREEIEAVRNYLAIEAIRFEGRLSVEVDVEPGLESAEVPGLLLHPLVENAITHGMMEHGPLSVAVRAERDRAAIVISVTNSGRWRDARSPAASPGTGTGLRNVEARLARLARGVGQLTIEPIDGRVTVRVRLESTEQAGLSTRPQRVGDWR